jgi:hypothetical protein
VCVCVCACVRQTDEALLAARKRSQREELRKGIGTTMYVFSIAVARVLVVHVQSTTIPRSSSINKTGLIVPC